MGGQTKKEEALASALSHVGQASGDATGLGTTDAAIKRVKHASAKGIESIRLGLYVKLSRLDLLDVISRLALPLHTVR